MLIHVFDKLFGSYPQTFGRFLKHAVRQKSIRSWREGHIYVIASSQKQKKLKWTSGTIFRKLRETNCRVTLPVLWYLLQYYNTHDEASARLRWHLNCMGIRIEEAPFCLIPGRGLYTRCASKGLKPVNSKKVQITLDKGTALVKIRPHKEAAQALLQLLEDVSL